MRRLLIIALALTLLPASAALATDLDELLEKSQSASYVADLAISCSTPDGVQASVVRIVQHEGQITVGSTVDEDVQVAAGSGAWALSRSNDVVTAAEVDTAEEKRDPLYTVEDWGPVRLLGRDAMAYRLVRDGVLRAELVFDDETGALVLATTFSADGTTYCQRQFISLNTEPPRLPQVERADQVDHLVSTQEIVTELPEAVEGFDRLDLYEDEDGFRFAYYSDGFFSFAVFETPTTVELPDGVEVEIGKGRYTRSFSPGQVTYVWETRTGGMALIGDLPPDMHESVLSSLPEPYGAGWWGRLWRRLFG